MKTLHRFQTSQPPFGVLAIATFTILMLTRVDSAAENIVSFRDFPYLIYCNYEGVDHGYYFSRLRTDGVAVYRTPEKLAGMISIDGVARRIDGDQSGTCQNKTLDELRSDGQAFDVPR